MFTTDDIIDTTSSTTDSLTPKRLRLRDPSDSPRAYNSLSVVRKLSAGKFPIYLTSSRLNKQNYAMKVFLHQEYESQAFYKNEIRFASLKHPNIIDMVHYEGNKEALCKGEPKKASYILMEYAPYGDFFDFIVAHKDQIDEKLTRTYFRQLIDGIEYLHENGIAHLDIKPENLLLGADFKLKIADFDLSHVYGDAKILSRGTPRHRAPEFFNESSSSSTFDLEQLFAADIYSAAVILFVLKSGGMYPHAENDLFQGLNFGELLYRNNLKFWNKHYELQGKDRSFFSRDFKELFNHMTRLNPEDRLTIWEIKQSRWYNGPVYTSVELAEKMKKILDC